MVPAARMVFVRFGEGYGDVDWPALFLRLSSRAAELTSAQREDEAGLPIERAPGVEGERR